MARARLKRRYEDDELPDLPEPDSSLVALHDGFPTRRQGEKEEAFEARLNACIASIHDDLSTKSTKIRSSILVAYIRHLNQGNPPASFCYRDSSGMALCDNDTIKEWAMEGVPEYVALEAQIKLALKQCEARWVEHLGNMASGRSGGNIKAVEMYMKRFFGWDVDISGQEEAKAIAEMFRGMAKGLVSSPKQIDV